MAYDAAIGKEVLFGGETAGKNGSTIWYTDTWTWDGTTWTKLRLSGGPSARRGAAMTYDAQRQVIVLFGGYGNVVNNNSLFLNDTWTFNGTSWTQLNPANPPSRRDYASLSFDPVSLDSVLFSGQDETGAFPGDTWIWDGTNWGQLSPSSAPSPRASYMLAYDYFDSATVLFGGLCGFSIRCNDTWYWSGNTWTPQTPLNAPASREFAGMAWLNATQTLMLFGGDGDTGVLGDTWTY